MAEPSPFVLGRRFGCAAARVIAALREMRENFPDTEITGFAAELATAEGSP